MRARSRNTVDDTGGVLSYRVPYGKLGSIFGHVNDGTNRLLLRHGKASESDTVVAHSGS